MKKLFKSKLAKFDFWAITYMIFMILVIIYLLSDGAN